MAGKVETWYAGVPSGELSEEEVEWQTEHNPLFDAKASTARAKARASAKKAREAKAARRAAAQAEQVVPEAK